MESDLENPLHPPLADHPAPVICRPRTIRLGVMNLVNAALLAGVFLLLVVLRRNSHSIGQVAVLVGNMAFVLFFLHAGLLFVFFPLREIRLDEDGFACVEAGGKILIPWDNIGTVERIGHRFLKRFGIRVRCIDLIKIEETKDPPLSRSWWYMRLRHVSLALSAILLLRWRQLAYLRRRDARHHIHLNRQFFGYELVLYDYYIDRKAEEFFALCKVFQEHYGVAEAGATNSPNAETGRPQR